MGAPSFVKIVHNGAIYMMRMIVYEFSMRFERDAIEIPSDGMMPFGRITASEHLDVSLNAHCLTLDDEGCLMKIKKEVPHES